ARQSRAGSTPARTPRRRAPRARRAAAADAQSRPAGRRLDVGRGRAPRRKPRRPGRAPRTSLAVARRAAVARRRGAGRDRADDGGRLSMTVAYWPGPEREARLLAGRRILLIIAGGIAAYKSLELIRRLREQGAAVR